MIPPGRLILLDTNVLLHLARETAAGKWIDEQYGLSSRAERPLISTVTVGEILRIALRNTWGEGKRTLLRQLLGELIVVDIGQSDILDRYAQIGAELWARGHPMSDNDLWIAATASARDAVLLTTDRDFDPLYPEFLERLYLDPDELARRQ